MSTYKLIHNIVHCGPPTLFVKTIIVNENVLINSLPLQIYGEIKIFLQKILISSYHLSQQINKNLRMVHDINNNTKGKQINTGDYDYLFIICYYYMYVCV